MREIVRSGSERETRLSDKTNKETRTWDQATIYGESFSDPSRSLLKILPAVWIIYLTYHPGN
jgi:hypothetical protein